MLKEVKEQISNNKIRRLKPIIREYSIALGLKDLGERFSAKQHIIRICSNRPEIRAVVRPLGGKLCSEQYALFFQYMVDNPIGEIVVSQSMIADRPRKDNPRKPWRKLKKARKKEVEKRQEFYDSWEWKQARYPILKRYGARCMLCGSTRNDLDMNGKRVKICVDHIKPISKRWDLRLDPGNLQVLCHDCNKGKGAWDETDFRPPEK